MIMCPVSNTMSACMHGAGLILTLHAYECVLQSTITVVNLTAHPNGSTVQCQLAAQRVQHP
jgi:hypothetical protein